MLSGLARFFRDFGITERNTRMLWQRCWKARDLRGRMIRGKHSQGAEWLRRGCDWGDSLPFANCKPWHGKTIAWALTNSQNSWAVGDMVVTKANKDKYAGCEGRLVDVLKLSCSQARKLWNPKVQQRHGLKSAPSKSEVCPDGACDGSGKRTRVPPFLTVLLGYEKLCSDTFLWFGTNKATGQPWNVTNKWQLHKKLVPLSESVHGAWWVADRGPGMC